MSATVDHLSAHKRIRVTRAFSDAAGTSFRQNETGRIRHIHFDWKTYVVTIELEQGDQVRNIVLHDPKLSVDGPKSGNLRDFFEVTGFEIERDALIAGTLAARPPEPPVRPLGPAWFQRALDLELQDRLDEAEDLIRIAVDNIYYAIATADMYRYRAARLAFAGDAEGAREARKKTVSFAWSLASMATSGGEGVALSRERDAYLEGLGYDPEELK